MKNRRTRIVIDSYSAPLPYDPIELAINSNQTRTNSNLYLSTLLVLICSLCSLALNAATYYVAPSGSDAATGDITHPFATISKAWTKVVAGDLIYVRGGTYLLASTSTQSLSGKNGIAGNLIKIWAYPGENPVFDYSSLTVTKNLHGFYLYGVNYVHIKGIRITNLVQFESGPVDGFRVNGSDNIIENCEVDHCGAGFNINNTGNNNEFINCDSHHNSDPYDAFEDANGFCGGGIGTIFRSCRSWFNCDDGFDFYGSEGTFILDNCWAFWNGYLEGFVIAGNGMGFKLGPTANNELSTVKKTLTNCLAFENRETGFDKNGGKHAYVLYNNVAYKNGKGGFCTNLAGTTSIVRNNISYANVSYQAFVNSESTVDHNTFLASGSSNNLYVVNNSDFESVSSVGMDGTRQTDGSLPILTFLHLASGSDLINTGIDVGIPYNDSYPDLGAFEFSNSNNPVASVNILPLPSGAICSGTSITFTATPTNGGNSPTYQWKLNGSNISGAINSTYTSSSLSNGDIITCVMTSSLANVTGNPATSNAIPLVVNLLPVAPLAGTITQPTCAIATGSVVLNGLPSSGTWTINPGGITGSGASKTISGLAAGTYSYTVTNASGCTSLTSAIVVINTQPVSPSAPIVGTITQPTCAIATGSVLLNGLPSSGTWTINPGGITGSGASKTISGLAAGNYSYTVTNASGCTSSASANVVINTQPVSPTAPIAGTITQPTCTIATGSVELNGLPSSGTWTINPGAITGSGASKTISGLAAGTYSYTVTNASGCTSSASANVVINTQPVSPTAPITGTITQPTCAIATGSVVLNNLPSTGTWTINPGGITGTGTSTIISGLAAGTYSYTVTNASGCTSSASANVVINTQPVSPTAPIAGTITQPTCTIATGSVELNGLPSSGTWIINPGAITGSGTSKTISGLAAGTYSYTVTNASGCTSSASANVVINTQPVSPTAPIAAQCDRDHFCTDDAGFINLSVIGGSGSTLDWFISNCGGSSIGTGNPLIIPSPTVTTTFYARWETANCSTSDCQSITVTVNALPANAGSISGEINVFQGQNAVSYSISPITNATSYVWTLPNGATGTSSTNSIIVDYGTSANSGIISVTGMNSCGIGTASTLAIVVNQTPVIYNQSFSILENSTNGSNVGTAVASDPDAGQILTFAITSGNTDNAFTIDPAIGNIIVSNSAALNFQNNPVFNLLVRVSDNGTGNLYDDASITINILQSPNQTPVINNQSYWVIENSPNSSLVDTVVATDPDAGQIISFSIISGNTGNAFSIDPFSGILTVNNSVMLNYQTNPVFNLYMRATDNGPANLFDDAIITIDVLPTPNHSPVISNQTLLLTENSVNGTSVGTIVASDPDTGQTLMYSILSGNTNNAFSINPVTGELIVANTTATNFEENPSFALSVNVQDNGMGLLSSQATIRVTILDVNEPPLTEDQTFTTIEMPANGTQIGIAAATDPDIGQILFYSITAGNTDNAFAIDPASGIITVNNSIAVNYLVNPVFILNLRVADNGIGNLYDDATITVNVLQNSNNPPSISDQVFRIDENSPMNFFVGKIIATDPDFGQTLTYAILAGNTAGAFTINSLTGEINVANPTILDYETMSLFHLIIQVQDNGTGNLSNQATAFVTLLDVNETPLVEEATFNIYESSPNGTIVGNIIASDPDLGQLLSYSLISGNLNDAFAINPVNGSILVNNSTALNFLSNPTYDLTIRVTDDGEVNLSSEANIHINILEDPNQSPVINDQHFQVNENSANGTQIGTIIAMDPDAGQLLGYSIISGNDNNAFTLNSTSGLLTVNNSAALNFELNQSFNLRVIVEDNGAGNLIATANISVEIDDLNEPPVFTDQTFNLMENSATGTLIGKLIASDPDAGQTISWAIISGNTGNTFNLNSATGNLYVANPALLVYATNPIFSLLVKTQDNGQGMLATSAYVTINLTQNTDHFVFIDPSQANNPQENGSLLNPYNSWTDVTFTDGYSYFQKRGTTYISTSNIIIYGKNNITLDCYGAGNAPVIQNNTLNAKVVDVSSSKYCTIRNFEILSSGNALSCIYMSGNSGSEIKIENCNLHGALYGVRSIQKGNGLHILNCTISQTGLDGIYAANFLNIEIGSCNIFEVNQKWFQNPGASESTGDCIELNSATGVLNIHHNNLTHTATGNMAVISISGNAYSGLIEKNTIEGNRLINNECLRLNSTTKTIVVRYNTISEGLTGINTNVSSSAIYYNQFIGNSVAIKIQKNKPADIKNNTFLGNISYSIESLSGASVTSRNNIFYLDAQSTKVYKFGGPNVSDYNTFNVEKPGFLNGYSSLSLWSDATNQDKNSMIADPLFVNISNKDLRLQLGSPCIDKGTNMNQYVDFFGTAVPQGGVPDIGFHEVESAAKNHLSLTTDLLGSKNADLSISASVYPNPTKGTLYISLQNSENSEADINILNMQGKIVTNKSSHGDSLIVLNLDNLNPGLYIAVITINGKILTHKIIVQD